MVVLWSMIEDAAYVWLIGATVGAKAVSSIGVSRSKSTDLL